MAPLRNPPHLSSGRRRSSLALLSTRRRSFAPKNYTFAPNVTPITYPSDPTSPSSNPRSSESPNPEGLDTDIKESDELATLAAETAQVDVAPGASRPRRRGGRKGSVDHIPRPPNAFMLFRQNFVHQRHVPGSIETSHNSLSKIVGNCWKALPSKEKKVWETLAEKKKEEHKIQYPHYRFQPKHDPEKKRKRQAARAAAERAERERILREQGQLAGSSQSVPEIAAEDKLRLHQPDREQEKDRAMASRREQVRAMHNHLGHRRSSSVPLPSETYPGYPYNNIGGAYGQSGPNADPFNFANPALAQQTSATSSNGIALPALPSSIGGIANSWYASNNAETSDEPGLQNSEQFSMPSQLHAPQPRAATLSRAASPRAPTNAPGMGSVGFGFGEFSGMSSMGMNLMGMGPRASRQWALGQLGRRASSTQPMLQHQLASGVFNNYHYSPQSAFPHSAVPFGQHAAQGFTQGASTIFDFGANQNQQQDGFDGFVGAVAEGFTNPFASGAPANATDRSTAPNSDSASVSVSGSYPAPLAPNAMWYEVDSVDPMTPVGSQPPAQYAQASSSATSLPRVDSSLLNPSFHFSSAAANIPNASRPTPRIDAPPSPKSASVPTSAPQTAMQTNFGPMSAPMHNSNSAPGTGMRDSFDFSAFNAFLSQMPAQNNGQFQTHSQIHSQEQQQTYENVPPNSIPSNDGGYSLAQPVPVRKTGLPCVPETHAPVPMYHDQSYPEQGSYQEQYVPEQVHVYSQEQNAAHHDHAQYNASQQSSSASSGSSADASPASGFIPMGSQHQQPSQLSQHQQRHEAELVSGHELLDGPVDVNAMSSAHSSNIPQQAQVPTNEVRAPGGNALDFGYHQYNGMAPLEAQNMYQMHMGYGEDMGPDYGAYTREPHASQTNDGSAHDSNDQSAPPRFSFSDFVHGSPFINSTSAVAN